MIQRLRVAVTPFYLGLCLVLGGASAAGYWANMALQLLAVPIIVWAASADRPAPSRPAKQLLVLLLLMLLVIGLQLIPLPPGLWTSIPGRAPVVEGLKLIGEQLPWLPVSLDPYLTVASALWLLPAIAVLLGVVKLGAFVPSRLAWALVALTVISVVLGAAQVAGGEDWYIYQITNHGFPTGFFANTNHEATLMVATVPFVAALYLRERGKARSIQHSSSMFVVLAGTLAVIAVGIAMASSLAAIGLALPVLAASVLMILSRRRKLPVWTVLPLALLLVGSVATVFTSPFANNLTTQGARGNEDSRYTSFTVSTAATGEFMPVGSGIGTFQQIYRTREDPATVDSFYMNHVHGDYIEVALETGIPGLIVVGLFLLWWARRCLVIWRHEDQDYFARAATIASAAILAHSIVDYPLRTAAIGAVFAMCCALMAEPREQVRTKKRPVDQRARHLSAG